MHRTDKYSEHSSIIWPVLPNGWVFAYEPNGSGFESSCSHLDIIFRTCFEQGVPWHPGNYRVWIHSENADVTWQEHTVKCTVQISTQNTAQSFGQFGQMVECSLTNQMVLDSIPVAVINYWVVCHINLIDLFTILTH